MAISSALEATCNNVDIKYFNSAVVYAFCEFFCKDTHLADLPLTSSRHQYHSMWSTDWQHQLIRLWEMQAPGPCPRLPELNCILRRSLGTYPHSSLLSSALVFLSLFLNGRVGLPRDSEEKNLPAMQEPQKTQVWSLGWEDLLEEGMATDSHILAWRSPWTEEPGGLQSIGSQRGTRLKRLRTHTCK